MGLLPWGDEMLGFMRSSRDSHYALLRNPSLLPPQGLPFSLMLLGMELSG